MKKTIAKILTLALALSLTAGATDGQAATAKLSKKKLTIVVGSSKKLTLKGAKGSKKVGTAVVVGALGEDKTTATISMNQRDENGKWKQLFSSPAFVGKNGLCEDADHKEGMHYNEMVNIKDYPNLDKSNSEHIIEYEYPYQYCLNISFNEEGTAGRGSAIFLHCFGTVKPYTGGCVSVPEYIMKKIMQVVSPDCVVVIDTLEDMGATL